MKGIKVSENVYAVSEQTDTENFTVELSKLSKPVCSIYFNHEARKIVIIKKDELDNLVLTTVANLAAVHKSFIAQQVPTTNLFGYKVFTITK